MFSKKLLALFFLVLAIFLLLSRPAKIKQGPVVDSSEIYQGVSYEAVDKNKYDVSILADKLFSPTRIKITPNAKHLLVSQITGEVLALDRQESGWSKPYPVTKIETKFPGFPPDEAGLVGIAFSENYSENGKVFFLYTYKDKDEKVLNRISSAVLKEKNGKLAASFPKLIFQANIEGNRSHQITDGIPINLNGEARLTFLIGEGFDAKRAQDPNLQAGKLMSIKEDGTDAKIHALGIRNGYVLSADPLDKDGKIKVQNFVLNTLLAKEASAYFANNVFFKRGQFNLGENNHQKIIFSKKPTNSQNIFLFHKTTNRELYDEEYKKYSKLGFADVIFRNEKDQITEGTISNIFIKKNGKFYTSPIECGLLNGVYRQYFMKKNKVIEKILYERDLRNADEIFICNSVRGIRKVKIRI